MFARSFGLIPVTVLMRISIPSPSGYWGAWRSMRHSGNTNAPRSIAVARASSVLESFVTVSSRTRWEAGRRDADVARHLLVQRRAEVRAVERVDPLFLREPRHRARLTRLQDQLGRVLPEHREAVEDVPVLLDVRDVELHRVADLHALDVVGRKVAADRDHPDVHGLADARDARLRLGAHDVRIRVLSQRVELDLLVLDHARRNRLRVVRLADGREVEQHLHLLAGDVD